MKRLLTLCTDERIDAVLLRLIADAARGDAAARELFLKYTLGKAAGIAPTPTTIAVEDESGRDPLASAILFKKLDELS